MKKIIILVTMIFWTWVNASTCTARGPNVILFTVDGVRTQDFFNETYFPKFWNKHSHQGATLGRDRNYTIGSKVAVSLPSYQAMMTGEKRKCLNNRCGQVTKKSFLNDIRENLDLPLKDVAVIASWKKISHALAASEKITKAIYPEMVSIDKSFEQLQLKALEDLPSWSGSRKDKYTFEMGIHYLKTHCPRVLFLSLVDADEHAHDRNFDAYTGSLKIYDSYLEKIIATLNQLGEYGKNTTLFFTTDHSRGSGRFWSTHGLTPFTDKKVFLYMWGRGVTSRGVVNLPGNHRQLRPTIMRLMGLEAEGDTMAGIF